MSPSFEQNITSCCIKMVVVESRIRSMDVKSMRLTLHNVPVAFQFIETPYNSSNGKTNKQILQDSFDQ